LIGVSKDQTESKPVSESYEYVPIFPNNKKPTLYLLAVGINEYKNSKYNLEYCINDMKSFSDTMKTISHELFDHIKLKTLENSNANKTNILTALDEVSKLAKPQDVFIFYYAGHGIALETDDGIEFFFAASEVTQLSDIDNCESHGVSGTELKEKLRLILANKQIALIDACNAGAFVEQFVLRGPKMENSIAKLSRSTGSAIYASTTADQYAGEYKELGHGAFTYVLLNALSGATSTDDCQVTAAGLKSYIDNEVPKITERFKGTRQYPFTFLFGQDFPIGLRCR